MHPSVFIVDFEQVSFDWEAKGEIDYRIHLNEFSVSKSLYWKQSKWDQQNFFYIFMEIMFAFLLHLLIENFKPESYCLERNNRIYY